MQTQLLKVYQLLDVITSLKEDIMVGIENSVGLYNAQKDDPTQSTQVNFDVVTMNDEEYLMGFETKSAGDVSICSTVVKFEGQGLAAFRFEDGDFDATGSIKPEVQDFIMTFIGIELKNRKLNEIIAPLLYNNNVYNLHDSVTNVGKAIEQFGLEAVVNEGETITTVSVVRKDPHDILGSTTINLASPSTHSPALISITLIELTKAVLFSLFDKNELTVKSGE